MAVEQACQSPRLDGVELELSDGRCAYVSTSSCDGGHGVFCAERESKSNTAQNRRGMVMTFVE